MKAKPLTTFQMVKQKHALAKAQARLNRAAVAWLYRGQNMRSNIMRRIIELERAVRAFRKAGGK